MPAQPAGEPAPLDGSLPASATLGAADRGLSLYIHVPYCRVRCGYCDFNTYTAEELGPGASRSDYRPMLAAELDFVAGALRRAGFPDREVSTVFFGGGTPTLLDAEVLAGVLDDVRGRFPLAAHAEVTTEANPDTLSPQYLATLAAAGFTRVSLGMQSAVPDVLATLDRTHDAARIPQVVAWVKDAGLQVSLDLIYGTPGESLTDWRTSVEQAIACAPDHLSAYSLIIEDGTKMAAQIRRGQLPMPSDDDAADKYELADELLSSAGYQWYEVSNFSTGPDTRCRHNLAYWRGADWWGFGPGAHSHLGGVRMWNAKHPRAWADRLNAGHSPVIGREILDPEVQELERIMLTARLRDELSIASLPAAVQAEAAEFARLGMLDPVSFEQGLFSPTLHGRLLCDLMVRRMTEAR